MNANEPQLHTSSNMSDEERIALLADIILDAISAEDSQAAEAEG